MHISYLTHFSASLVAYIMFPIHLVPVLIDAHLLLKGLLPSVASECRCGTWSRDVEVVMWSVHRHPTVGDLQNLLLSLTARPATHLSLWLNSSLSGHCWRRCLMTSVGSSGIVSQSSKGLSMDSLFYSLLHRIITTTEAGGTHICLACCVQ